MARVVNIDRSLHDLIELIELKHPDVAVKVFGKEAP